MDPTVPALKTRLKPLLLICYPVAAIRLALDFWDRESVLTQVFGLYYASALGLVVIGLQRRWGLIRFKQLLWTLFVAAALSFGICNCIAYTVGQFMEWQDGRFFPGTPVLDAAGAVESYGSDHRAVPLQAEAYRKVGAGLLHGVLTTLVGTVWMTLFASVFVLVIKRPEGV